MTNENKKPLLRKIKKINEISSISYTIISKKGRKDIILLKQLRSIFEYLEKEDFLPMETLSIDWIEIAKEKKKYKIK